MPLQLHGLHDCQAGAHVIPKRREQDRPAMQVSYSLPQSFGFQHLPGTSITPLTVAIVEMDVGIIAASLIVMRPVFEALRNAISKRYRFYRIKSTRDSSYISSTQGSGLPWDGVIVRTVDLELERQPIATHSATSKPLGK